MNHERMTLLALSVNLSAIPSEALGVGALVALGVGFVMARPFFSRAFKGDPFANLGPSSARQRVNSEFWEVLPTRANDRRMVPRREGNPTPINLVGPDGRKRQSGCVLDRNSGGVRLANERPADIGAELLLLAEGAPKGTPWVKVQVVWCKAVNNHYEIGCRFAEPVPWNIMLLFG